MRCATSRETRWTIVIHVRMTLSSDTRVDDIDCESTRGYAVVAGCIVYRITDVCEILLVKQKQARVAWGIPKGHVEPGESWEDAAVRETLEETGIDSEPEHMLVSTCCATPTEYKRLYTYLARVVGPTDPDPITADEVFDVRWWSIDALPDIHEYQLDVVLDGVQMLNEMFPTEVS